jgi:hypothetical protein
MTMLRRLVYAAVTAAIVVAFLAQIVQGLCPVP